MTGEALYSLRKVNVDVADADGDGVTDTLDRRQRDHWGWYVGGEVQPWRRLAGGVRFDWSQYPADPGYEWSVEPYVTLWPSEFLRFRLAYKRTDRSTQTRDQFNLNGGSARTVDELLLPGHVLPRRPPRASLLGGEDMRRTVLVMLVMLSAAGLLPPNAQAAPGSSGSSRPFPISNRSRRPWG